jgi:hypothetical protein
LNAARLDVGRAGLAAVFVTLTTIADGGPVSATPPDRSAPSQRIEAGPVVLEQELDRASMLAAERLTLTWRVLAPLDTRVTLPPSPEPGAKAGDFSVVSCIDEPPRMAGDRLMLTRRLVLEPFLPGTYATPTIEVEWSASGNERGVARTSTSSVEVVSLLGSPASDPANAESSPADSLDPGPIRDEHLAPPTGGGSWLLPAGALLAMAAVAGGVLLATRRRRFGATDPAAVALALANAASIEPGDPASARRALDDLSRSLRTALADRVTDRAASIAGFEPASASVELEDDRSILLEDALPLLGILDERRFSGQPLPAEELDTLRRRVVELVTRLHSLPRGHGGSRA